LGGEIFRTRPDRPWGHSATCTMGTGSFPGGTAAGAWSWPPTLSSAEVKKRVELYPCPPFGSSWSLLGWILPLALLRYTSRNVGKQPRQRVKLFQRFRDTVIPWNVGR